MDDKPIAIKCQQLIRDNLVTIFSKTTCPFCTRVKLLFKSLNISPLVYELDTEPDGQEIQNYLFELTKQRTVPNVFVQGKHVGGCDDTMKAYGNGTLNSMLKGGSVASPEKKIQALLEEHSVVIFSKSTCHNSAKVKSLFKNMGIKPKMYHLDKESNGVLIQEYLSHNTKSNSTPTVFVRGKYIGGFYETSKAFGDGEIKRLLSMPNLVASEKKFNELIKANKVVIFSKTTPDAYKVKDIFYRLGVKPVVYSLDEEPDGDEMEQIIKQRSESGVLPQTFVQGTNVGNYDQVKEEYESGKLGKLVVGPEANEIEVEDYDYDLIVVGGGSGGLAAAKEAANLGKSVALCDFVKPTPMGTTWGLGGTCVNVGCIPKKLMHQASIHAENHHDSISFGWSFPMSEDCNFVNNGGLGVAGQHSWDVMVENVQNYIKSLNFGYRKELNLRKVKYFNAYAEFVDPHRVKLTNKKGDVSELSAKEFIIAVGGRPAYPDVPGAREYCITSDDLFSLSKPPGKTLIVGASYIALECGGFLKGLGYDVTIMVRSILLRGFDRQFADLIGEHMEKIGVKFVKGYEPTGFGKREDGKLKVAAKSKDGEEITVQGFDTVILAIGREACTSKIGLENLRNLRINPKNKKIMVDDFERTTVPNVYAIGDVIDGKPELTPVAIHAGKYLAQRLAGIHNKTTNYKQVPTTVFTPLEYGAVGLSEEEAYEIFGQDNIIVYHNAFKPLEHALSRDETLGYAKLICVKSLDELVVGFHVLSPNAGEITQGFAIGLKLKAKKSDFDDLIGIHPTCAEVFTTLSTVKNPGDKPPETTGC
ncbi:hypothetical protein RUM43_000587 [Polyplax serrata]|uniref:thioredoxin-disulfide reductase (NADPH) n=1 Tax=Polyplax serrata TaxID=468196 RepID=A0AAN8XP91_POLSC